MKQKFIRLRILMLLIGAVCCMGNAYAQKIPMVTSWEEVAKIVAKDTTKPRPIIKGYNSVINKSFKSQFGLFAVHRAKDTVYFEIPDSVLQRDIMVINRIGKVSGGYGVYAGEELDEKTIKFEKGIDSTIRIRLDLVISEADSTSNIYKAVVRSNLNPVVVSFPIVAYGKDNKSYVIDASKFLKEKSLVNNIDPKTQLAGRANTATMKDFNIETIHVYPINVEISISKNLEAKGGTSGAPGDPMSMESHTSFIALPIVPLQRRFFDPRVGYFADYYNAYADDQQRAEQKKFILRWRLEPKDEDVEKWKKGELVEPKKQIVIYIDPAAPKQWRPYLIKGINDWQAAFVHAGFKNAIVGKEWPENDTTMHMDDARYSMLNYFPSEIANAYGPQVHDPRSGEIIQTHIGWYHNVMSILHDWYQIQASGTDPEARKAKFDIELMGQLIRFVSSHEVGHTLGLRHNFGSSSQTPVDSLRNKHYLKAHGHTASIMDYARFNYVAQPEDNIPQQELFPHIGEYDNWAIKWGYKNSGATNPNDDKKIVSEWIVEQVTKNKRLWFGDGESKRTDPRNQMEDLGDDAIKASIYGIKNLKRILPNLPAWTREDDGLNEGLASAYKALTDQYARYMNHVLKNLGGVYYNIKSDNQPGAVYTPATKRRQRDALYFFNTQLFQTPYWLLNQNVLNKVNMPTGPNFVEDIQVRVLNSLLDMGRINKLIANTAQFGEQSYPVDEYLATIHKGIWQELKGDGLVKIGSYRRNLQKSYWGAVLEMLSARDPASTETDASSLLKADVLLLQIEVKRAIPRVQDPLTLYHLKDIEYRIKNAMDNKKGI
jgi:hypothetical protein